ncbi:unnamed protein product [Lupinus luteus]|uniref:RING-type E3 ubiquitin transferase n=1 Tax=Lupinus luteus TaxID=3873 RepID=A0AAV1W9S3_LUPLU
MVKISVGRYDDGEGPSNPTQKRRRLHHDETDEEEEEENQQQQQQQEQEQEEQPQQQEEQPQQQQQQGFGIETTEEDRTTEEDNETVESNTRDRSISITLMDPDVLDCCICYEPFSAPIFQCENGHIACSNCCGRLGNKCPMCSMPIGYNRCRAIEKVLESIKMSCLNTKYGCKEKFSYSKKNDHEKECIYIPCLCPHPGCDFVAAFKELSLHFSHRHIGSAIPFVYDKFLPIVLNLDHKEIILQEKNDGSLFIVRNSREHLGNIVHLSCIGPKSVRGFHYEILARSQGSSLILTSVTKIIQGFFPDSPSTGRLLIPSDFFGSGTLKLDIRIRSRQ